MKTSKSSSGQALDYWRIFRGLPEAYLLMEANDPEYTIVDLNKARERITPISRKEAIGRPLFDVYPHLATGENPVRKHLQSVLKAGRSKTVQGLHYPLRDVAGNPMERHWQSTYVPLRDAAGKITHIVASTKDITEELAAQKRTHEAEERLKEALTIGKVGSWLWDITSGRLIADSFMAKLFGVNTKRAAVGFSVELFQGMVHPDDKERVMQAVQDAIRRKGTFESEYRLVHKGKVRWVLARGRVEERGASLYFPGVIVDITERRDLQAQIELARQQDKLNRQAAKILQQRNEELEAISRTKDEFVALASHQLRTPATAVKQYLGMVLQGYVGEISGLQAEMLGKAFESNERQIEIINQILNAARVDTGRLMMTHMPLDMTSLLEGIAADLRPSIEQHGHAFDLHLPKLALQVRGDRGYLRMAIENIIDNACLYTPEGGSVAVRLDKQGNRCVVQVSDTGVGIRKADLSKLFVKFSRIHNPLSVQAGGSGIGLYLAGEIIKLHGGSIAVESKIGRGTTFAISLPLVHNEVKSGAELLPNKARAPVRKTRNMRTGLQTHNENSLQ